MNDLDKMKETLYKELPRAISIFLCGVLVGSLSALQYLSVGLGIQ